MTQPIFDPLGLIALKTFTRLCLILIIASVHSPFLFAFDTGHHTDMTRAAMRRMGYSSDASDAVVLENWITDLYGNWFLLSDLVPGTYPIDPNVAELKFSMEKLHFDNLVNEDRVAAYWEQLVLNTQSAIQRHVKEPSDAATLDLLTDLGISLHVIQDFYSHSNWVECYGRNSESDPFNTRTWFDLRQAGPVLPCHNKGDFIRTGSFKNTEFPKGYSPTHDQLNKDRYSRDAEKWAQAYVYAYVASLQWISAFERWIIAADPSFDLNLLKSRTFCGEDADQLRRDLKEAHDLSSSIPSGGGHWKGTGSEDTGRFAASLTKWALDPASKFKKQFTEQWKSLYFSKDLYTRLVPTTTNFFIPPIQISETAIIIKTISAENWSDRLGPVLHNSFFAKIEMKAGTAPGQLFVESVQRGSDGNNAWPWYTIYFAPNNADKVSVRYELDSEDNTQDYIMHIYPQPTRDYMLFDYYPGTNSSLGDITGTHATNATAATNVTYATQAQNPSTINGGRVDAKLRLVIDRKAID